MASVYEQFRRLEGGPKGRAREGVRFDFRPALAPDPPRCRCGKCRQCADEARWERIFSEKFADPEYYTRRPARQGSSLNWLR